MDNTMTNMSLDHLRAGGIVPADVQTPDDLPVDPVGVRAYSHPALPGRIVARLNAVPLAQGDDLEMEILGFSGEVIDRGEVGVRKRQALGFPGWALVHDPVHARYALEVLKDFSREMRLAKSKPGHAKTGIDGIAKRLGRSVASFLPSFYEEAGRGFLEAGSQSYASQMFGKAREAERVHALEVDEDHRRASFLEFGLAGAVSIKVLREYAKELQKNLSPEEAYRHFRLLAIKRTLGGMPPYSQMASDLRRLAKAAGLGRNAEDLEVVREIIESPSLARASNQFWTSYRKAIITVAKTGASVRGTLLNLFPLPSQTKDGFHGAWLNLLAEAGCLEALILPTDEVPTEARPEGGRAAWFTKLISHTSLVGYYSNRSAPDEVFGLLRRMAPQLITEDKPITLGRRIGVLDFDLSELALELGIATTLPDNGRFDLERWAQSAGSPERGRDPVQIIEDERLSRLLDNAIGMVIGKESFEETTRDKPAFQTAKRRYFQSRIAELSHPLPGAESALARIISAATHDTFVDFPEEFAAIEAVDLAESLARTLRGGIFAELGWEAFDGVVEALQSKTPESFQVFGNFPFAIVTNRIRAVVVGPKGRVLDHDLHLPTKSTVQILRYVGEQLLVVYQAQNYQWHAYWSQRPQDHFEVDRSYGRQAVTANAIRTTDGALVEGQLKVFPGQKKVAGNSAHLLFDGESFWTPQWDGTQLGLREFDPNTGEQGRWSLPEFLESFAETNLTIDPNQSWLAPLPEGLESTPLGTADGLIGWRVRRRADTPQRSTVGLECEAPDGRRWEGVVGVGATPSALVTWPGDDKRRPVEDGSGYRFSSQCTIYDADGELELATVGPNNSGFYHWGTPWPLTTRWWHLFTPRDEKASSFLRTLSLKAAQELLKAAVADAKNAKPSNKSHPSQKTAKVVAKLLPRHVNPRLIQGVTGVAVLAGQLEAKRRELIESADGAADAVTIVDIDERAMTTALADFEMPRGYGRGEFGQHLAAVSAFFETKAGKKPRRVTLPRTSLQWQELVGHVGSLAWRAASLGGKAEHKETLVRFLKAWRATIFAREPERFRLLRFERRKLEFLSDNENPCGLARAGNLFYVQRDGHGTELFATTIVEHAQSGTFNGLKEVPFATAVTSETTWATSDRIDQFLGLLAQKGPVPWDSEIGQRIASETGLSEAEATLIWLGFPNVHSWESNFLAKDVRETVGLKVKQAQVARDSVRKLPWMTRIALLDAAMPPDVARLWTPLGDGPDDPESPVARFCRAFIELEGKRVPIPEELIVGATKAVGSRVPPSTPLGWFAAPDESELLTQDGDWFIAPDSHKLTKKHEVECFDGATLHEIPPYIAYLFAALPVGDPLRDGIPRVLAHVRARLASERLMFMLASQHYYSEKQDEADRMVTAVVDALGGKPMAHPPGRDREDIVSVKANRHVTAFFRPSKVTPAKVGEVFRQVRGDDLSPSNRHDVGAYVIMMSPAFDAFAARVKETPVPVGQFECNPKHSVPRLVSEVGEHLDLTEEAATLYLQLLALAAPQDKAVRKWNGWTAAQLKKAQAQLVERELVLEAKRTRAGRKHFLPGGWEALKSPHPPIETWKLALYGAKRNETWVELPLERFLVPKPHHLLFAEAWERVTSGDPPKYEDV